MAKYKRTDVVEDDTQSYSDEVSQAQPVEQDNPEDTWKNRYGDLRRHTQQQMHSKDSEIADIKRQLDSATKGQIKFPKSDEEIQQWSSKYPEVANIVDTIARKRASEALEEGEKRLEGLKQLETKLTRKEAEQELIRMHPDFADIRRSQEFHDWVALQPTNMQDALYKNNTDAHSAGRAIDLYKADKRKAKRANPKTAASSVGRTSSSAPSTHSKPRFSESQINSMTLDEYEANEADIMEAMRTKRFEYDVSGGAR